MTKEQNEMLCKVIEREPKLNKADQNFIDRLSERDEGYHVSEWEYANLDRIYKSL